ncbi:TonB-dependent receptor [Methylomonas sp. SURF-1]|uniref:TonB-dependent receptor n=1 Tax=Methylomonas aurea TaxID=2952224 RepID=A0ABT1UF98_9GAMM|nr:TonB-dependent receptor [Methylomonas sp. SURF-1]MCQ8180907.1 TonB-dependent receptor [Methylomonas sp. SURF-1]
MTGLTNPSYRRSNGHRIVAPMLALSLAIVGNTRAGTAATSQIDLPAQSLAASLDSLAKTSGAKLIYADSLVNGIQADALHGEFSVPQALERLLNKHGLQFENVGDGVITIKKAPPAPKPQSVRDDSIFELGEVTVSDREDGNKLTSKDIATSVDIMYADKIQDQNVITAYDLLHRMPGVQITQFGQGTTTGKFSFRAFNGEGNINAVKLLIDGIPSNTNDGNMPFIDALFPLDIESIEIVRGTNDPRYGLHNIAGNANIRTAAGGNYVKGRISYGSFGTHEIQSGLGIEKNGFTQNYAISYRGLDGYRDHGDSEKNSFSGKWFYTGDDNRYKIGLSARWSDADSKEPGYLTYEEQLADPTQSLPRNATDGGKRSVGQVSVHLDANFTDQLFWSIKSYGNYYDDQRFVKFNGNNPLTPASLRQQERGGEETQFGAITSLTYHPVIEWLEDFILESGFDFQQQENKSNRYRTVFTNRLSELRNQEFDFLVYGGYVQAVIKPTKWLKITPGYRADQIDGGFTDKITGIKSNINDYGVISQPKIGMVITPFEGYSLYGNWGRTFQVGVGSATYKTLRGAVDIGPSINDGWEVGVKVHPVDWAEGRVAYWMQDATNESSRVLNSANNDSVLLGATTRQGVDIQARLNPVDPLSIWVAYSLQEAKVKTAPANTSYSVGNQIISTPNYLFSGGIDYAITPALKTSLWTTGQDDSFADQANRLPKYGAYALLNLDLGYQLTKQVDLQFQVKNLTDTQREYVFYDASLGQMYSPGDGRAFYGAVNVKFDY